MDELYDIIRDVSPDLLTNHDTFKAEDCQDAFDNGERNNGAVYTLYTDPESAPVLAVCQFDDQSGWTVIQRRLDGTIDFNRGWDEYDHGFGNPQGEYWIGLENIFHLTKKNQKMSIFLEDHESQSRTANYSLFQIENKGSHYQLLVSGYSGDAGDSLSYHHEMGFSTFDDDNDGHSESCALTFQGGWWYDACVKANLNGVWHDANNARPSTFGVAWFAWKYPYSFKTVYMMIGN
ncbi:angiopoietin-related protein 1-like [Watersipora subatra]|uniref:angiopoietin-related protein 1-like n=1 Tax=Watersipora subatra TaxID=2589382 RepID=UPI00355B8F60